MAGDRDAIGVLLEAGADPNRTVVGKTPLMIAVEAAKDAYVVLLPIGIYVPFLLRFYFISSIVWFCICRDSPAFGGRRKWKSLDGRVLGCQLTVRPAVRLEPWRHS